MVSSVYPSHAEIVGEIGPDSGYSPYSELVGAGGLAVVEGSWWVYESCWSCR